MGSLSLWQRLYEEPENEEIWVDFQKHYLEPVYRWAIRRVGNPAAAEEVTAAVFAKLYRRVRSARAGRVRHGQSGSYQHYVCAVVRTAVVDYFESVSYFKGLPEGRPLRLPEGVLAGLIDTYSLNDLEQGIRDYSEYEGELGRYETAYRDAVRELRASPHYDGQTYRVFLRVYGRHEDGVAAAADREFGWSRGMASRHTCRVRDRLLALMGLPIRDSRSEDILKLMVLTHGDPS